MKYVFLRILFALLLEKKDKEKKLKIEADEERKNFYSRILANKV